MLLPWILLIASVTAQIWGQPLGDPRQEPSQNASLAGHAVNGPEVEMLPAPVPLTVPCREKCDPSVEKHLHPRRVQNLTKSSSTHQRGSEDEQDVNCTVPGHKGHLENGNSTLSENKEDHPMEQDQGANAEYPEHVMKIHKSKKNRTSEDDETMKSSTDLKARTRRNSQNDQPQEETMTEDDIQVLKNIHDTVRPAECPYLKLRSLTKNATNDSVGMMDAHRNATQKDEDDKDKESKKETDDKKTDSETDESASSDALRVLRNVHCSLRQHIVSQRSSEKTNKTSQDPKSQDDLDEDQISDKANGTEKNNGTEEKLSRSARSQCCKNGRKCSHQCKSPDGKCCHEGDHHSTKEKSKHSEHKSHKNGTTGNSNNQTAKLHLLKRSLDSDLFISEGAQEQIQISQGIYSSMERFLTTLIADVQKQQDTNLDVVALKIISSGFLCILKGHFENVKQRKSLPIALQDSILMESDLNCIKEMLDMFRPHMPSYQKNMENDQKVVQKRNALHKTEHEKINVTGIADKKVQNSSTEEDANVSELDELQPENKTEANATKTPTVKHSKKPITTRQKRDKKSKLPKVDANNEKEKKVLSSKKQEDADASDTEKNINASRSGLEQDRTALNLTEKTDKETSSGDENCSVADLEMKKDVQTFNTSEEEPTKTQTVRLANTDPAPRNSKDSNRTTGVNKAKKEKTLHISQEKVLTTYKINSKNPKLRAKRQITVVNKPKPVDFEQSKKAFVEYFEKLFKERKTTDMEDMPEFPRIWERSVPENKTEPEDDGPTENEEVTSGDTEDDDNDGKKQQRGAETSEANEKNEEKKVEKDDGTDPEDLKRALPTEISETVRKVGNEAKKIQNAGKKIFKQRT